MEAAKSSQIMLNWIENTFQPRKPGGQSQDFWLWNESPALLKYHSST
jgi:hypothetical protein